MKIEKEKGRRARKDLNYETASEKWENDVRVA